MAYTKTVWQTGDVITAAKLNNAEDGIEANDPIIFTGVHTVGTGEDIYTFADVTWQDVFEAVKTGKAVCLYVPDDVAGDLYTHVLNMQEEPGEDDAVSLRIYLVLLGALFNGSGLPEDDFILHVYE